MKAEIAEERQSHIDGVSVFYSGILYDDDGYDVGYTVWHLTEEQAKEHCRKYFPQFRLDGEENTTLPGSFAVRNDGSAEFIDAVIGWMNNHPRRGSKVYEGLFIGEYYGIMNGTLTFSAKPFGTVLSLEQFKALTK